MLMKTISDRCAIAKAVLRGKMMALNIYTKISHVSQGVITIKHYRRGKSEGRTR